MLVGILGAGQLGRMLALAGYPLGLRFRLLDPAPDAAAGQLAPHLAAPYTDSDALARFASELDVATYEFENVPVAAVRAVAARVPVHPVPDVLEVAQDRLAEKRLFESLGIPTPDFAAVDSRADLEAGVARLGTPAVLKLRRGGYDGKGQAVLRSPTDAEAAWRALGGAPLLLERLVPFTRELSVLAVRGGGGEVGLYPLVENVHRAGILRVSRAPAREAAGLGAPAGDYARRVLDRFGYVGLLAMELFEVGGRLLANEIAPRVHNSGHWTIEGAETSQFENHLRAVTGLPLGSTAPRGHSAMLNLIGVLPDPAALLAVPQAHVHLYGKAPHPGRKLGHVTVVAADRAAVDARLATLALLVGDGAA